MDDKLIVGEPGMMSNEQAELFGFVCSLHTAWMQREDLMRQPGGGFAMMEQMANLMDQIVDGVPNLMRLTQIAITSPATPMPVSAAVEERAREAKHVIGRLLAETHYGNHALVSAADVNALTAALTNAQPIRAGVREAVAKKLLADVIGIMDGHAPGRGAQTEDALLQAINYRFDHLATPDDALTERASVIEECAKVAEASKDSWLAGITIADARQNAAMRSQCEDRAAVAANIEGAIRALITRAPGQGEGK